VNAAVDYDDQGIEGLREFIDHSALVFDQDDYKRDAPVTLMTVHSAKGLEFPWCLSSVSKTVCFRIRAPRPTRKISKKSAGLLT
jgi:ATP-dependent exoDNAse (exonuclease V) beta subunit